MDLRRTALALALLGTIQADVSAANPPTELEKIRSQFLAHRELNTRPLIGLGDKYREALVDLQNKLQKNADLDGLVIVRTEVERFDREKSPAAEISSLEPVARLQKIYAFSHDEEFAKIEGKLTAASATYRKKLEALMQRLTTAGEVDSALKVRSALEELGDLEYRGKIALDKGLILHFRFDGDSDELVRDSSEIGNNGRLMGDAKILSSGNRGRHAIFDGRGDFIEISHHDSLVLKMDGSISIWVRPKRLAGMGGLISKYHPDNSWTLRNWQQAELRKVGFGDHEHNILSKSELKDNRWTHLVVTLDGGKLAMYIDGKLDSESQRQIPLGENQNPVRIGSCYNGRYLNGAVDDVRIYRRALSAEEVAKLFQIES